MSVADCDKQLFHAACEKVMRQQCLQKGIGTLSEKDRACCIKKILMNRILLIRKFR